MESKQVKKILIVDDQPEIIDVINEFIDLHFDECVIEQCQTVSEALETLEQEKFDVICTDLNLPVHSGFDLIDNLRASSGINRSTPIIVITASEISLDHKIFNHEATYLFSKQEQIIDLVNLIAELIES